MNNIPNKLTLIVAFLASLAGAFFVYTEYQSNNEKIIGLAIFVLVGVVTVSLLTYVIGLSIIGKVWAHRLIVVLSIIWLLASANKTEPYDEYGDITHFMQLGIMPLVVLWGFIWIAKGLTKVKT